MKILILGGSGMLGHKMFQTMLERGRDVHCTISRSADEPPLDVIPMFRDDRVVEKVNALDSTSLRTVIESQRPDVIVNCIGVIKQRPDAHSPIPSITINSLLPHQLVEWTGPWGGRVIHFSTDCVFSGRRGRYTEEDESDALDLYGRSKFLGEIAGPRSLTLRTSIIGRELMNFASLLEWFLAQKGSVRGYRAAIYSGVTTNYLSRLVDDIIHLHPRLSGLYHVTSPAISKYELLVMIRDRFGLDTEIEPVEGEVCDRSMDGTRFRRDTRIDEPEWSRLIDELAEDPTPYDTWRHRRARDV